MSSTWGFARFAPEVRWIDARRVSSGVSHLGFMKPKRRKISLMVDMSEAEAAHGLVDDLAGVFGALAGQVQVYETCRASASEMRRPQA